VGAGGRLGESRLLPDSIEQPSDEVLERSSQPVLASDCQGEPGGQ
jgi:hypothetical protein